MGEVAPDCEWTVCALLGSRSEAEVVPEDERAAGHDTEQQVEPVVERVRSSNNFVARPVPPTHANPTSHPRMTKTAALRLGIELPPPRARAKSNSSGPVKERVVQTPKSLSAPSIAPRATLTSSRRTRSDEPSVGPTKAVPRAALSTAERNALSAKDRRHSVQVASTAPPKVEVRLSKTAMLRTGVAQSGSATSAVIDSRSVRSPSKTPVKASAPPKIQVRLTKTAAMRTGVVADPSETLSRKAVSYEGVPGHKRRESIQVAATSQPPSIPPRLNRTAMLRSNSANEPALNAIARATMGKWPPTAQSSPSSRAATPLGERVNKA